MGRRGETDEVYGVGYYSLSVKVYRCLTAVELRTKGRRLIDRDRREQRHPRRIAIDVLGIPSSSTPPTSLCLPNKTQN